MANVEDVKQALRDLKPGCDTRVIEHARDVIESLWSFYRTLEPQIDRAQALGADLPMSKSGQIFDAIMDAYEARPATADADADEGEEQWLTLRWRSS